MTFQLNERVDVIPEVGEVIHNCIVVGRTMEAEPKYDVMRRDNKEILFNVLGKYIRKPEQTLMWDE
jgi:hypothetical protein